MLEKAQQEPHEPWLRILNNELQLGYLVLKSNEAGRGVVVVVGWRCCCRRGLEGRVDWRGRAVDLHGSVCSVVGAERGQVS